MKWMFLRTFTVKCHAMISEKIVFSISIKTCSEHCLSKLLENVELRPNKKSRKVKNALVNLTKPNQVRLSFAI